MRVLAIVAVSVMVGLASSAFAGDWSMFVDGNLTLTQSAYSDNWAGEETGAVAWTFSSTSLAEKQLHARVHNKNTLKLSFGQTYNQNRETGTWSEPVKSTDLIDFESIFRMTLGRFVDPFAAGRVESQFLDASDPDRSRYINPIRFTESLGVAKILIVEEKREWTVRAGGALRQYLDREVLDSLTGKWKTQTGNDGGIEFVTDFKTSLAQDCITFTSKLTLFQALFYSESDKFKGLPNEDCWRSPDVNWENVFTASITKYLMVNLYTQFLYDKEIDLGVRFKQTLSLGVTYRLI